MQKIGFWGSIASIVGLAIAFFPGQSESGNQTGRVAATQGNQSPAIGENNGSVNINYNNSSSPQAKSYVLRNAKGGSVLVVSTPSIEAAMDKSKHVCMVVAGTPIILHGETAKMGGIDMWQKVQINGGACASKVGWVAIENISYE